MPVNETLELAERLADGDRRRPRRRRREPRAPRAVRPRRGGGVRPARASRATRPRLSEALGASVRPILDGAQLAVTLRRTRAAHLARLRERAARRARRCSTCPYLFQRSHGARATRQVAEHLARGARVLMAPRRKRGVRPGRSSSCSPPRRSSSTAARAASARRPPPRPPAAMAAVHHGGKVLVLTVDPARRLANALGLETFGNVETQVPPEAFAEAGVEPRGELWAAMLDTKQSWDDLVRRHAPDAAHPRRDPRQPALQEHHRPVRAEPRLHRDGAALRDPRVGHLRPDRRRHAADPERHRLPRGARAHGRLLLAAACCAGSPCRPAAGC